MSKEPRSPETPEEPRQGAPTGDSRRSFIKKTVAISGAALLYLTPSVKVYAGQSKLSPGGSVFNISLPASYQMSGGTPFVLNFAVSGGPTIPVEFGVSGVIDLLPTATANVATVQMAGVMQSLSSDPLGPAGISCGQLTAEIFTGTTVGTLDLHTGVYTAAAQVPMELRSTACATSTGSAGLSGGRAAEQTTGDKCVIRDVDIALSVMPQGNPIDISGLFISDLRPALARR